MLDETQDNPNPETETPASAEAEAPGTDTATAAESQSTQSRTTTRSAPAGTLLIDDEDDYSDDERDALMSMYEESFGAVKEGEIVKGRVLRVGESEVMVDVGFKSEGVIAIDEFPEPEAIHAGDEIDVFLEKMENQDGLVVLSKQRADFVKVWDKVKDAADSGMVVEGRLLRKIKGGVVADLYGVEAFLPGSQISIRQVHNLDELFNQTLRFKIIKLNKRRRNIVISRRAVLEEEREKMKTQLLTELEKGQIREGTVKNITDFGAFVDLGGIDGLLHITDMSYGRVTHPSQVVKIGDTIKIKVLNFDRDRERISLGLKQLQPYPWENVDEKYPAGSRVQGRVVSITDYGAFVELEEGVEGLVHVSEMSWTRHVRHPSKVVSINDQVEAVVLKVDKEHEKISLGMKQVEPDPWETLDIKYPPGTRLVGKVRNLTNFGAFVEIEEGIDGLVHVSDMSWTKRVMHPSEIVKKGEDVEVVVLKIDKDERRVSLGIKQTVPSPWEEMTDHFPPDHLVKGRIKRLLDKGVVVDLGDEIEGFVPVSQLQLDIVDKPEEIFKEGDELPLAVMRVDPDQQRIVLSVKRAMDVQDTVALDEFNSTYGSRRQTLGEIAGVTSEELRAAGERAAAEEAGKEAARQQEEASESESAGDGGDADASEGDGDATTGDDDSEESRRESSDPS
ncbi:MAG: 30S ribosomal protein S1 [Candidatus Eiseniibacteriota bacterium]|jgi:small subunit ribosomal protein S1